VLSPDSQAWCTGWRNLLSIAFSMWWYSVGEGRHPAVLGLGPVFWGVCAQAWDLHSASQTFCPSFRWDRIARGDCGYFPSIRLVRLWLDSFPWGQTLLRRTEYTDIFQNGSFPYPATAGRDFSTIPMWGPGLALGGKPYKNVGGPSRVLKSQSGPYYASSHLSIAI
jgi:hypothetical protein